MLQNLPDRNALTSREREVLEAIVANYIQTGIPVSSRAISKVNSEHLSPATLRSIMADLEEAGCIAHPHTSAGRVPTDLGYRLYVDSLETGKGLSSQEKRRLSDDLLATGGIESLLVRCCQLLSVASNQIGVGTAPDAGTSSFRHLEFVKLSESRLLVLYISASGLVHQHVVGVRVEESQPELHRYANFLNSELAGLSLREVRERLASRMRDERTAYDVLARRALQLGAQYFAHESASSREVHVEGAEHLLERPDLSEFDRMKQLLAALEEKSRVLRILDSCLANEGVVTAIGSENQAPELAGCSLVATSYGIDDEKMGMLAIIGPTRMDYDRAMKLVEHVAQLLGTALASSRS